MKKVLLILSIFSLIASLALCVEAHSGRTDSSGGHTNHKTGGYHYHHGYPAHDHYDMDGDGDIDCPYNFKDKTNSNQNNSNNKTEIYIPEFPTFDLDSIPQHTYNSYSSNNDSHTKGSTYDEDDKCAYVIAGVLLAWIVFAPLFGRK